MPHKNKEIAAYRNFLVWAPGDLNPLECVAEFWNHLTFATTFIKTIRQQNKRKNYPAIETRLFIKKRGKN